LILESGGQRREVRIAGTVTIGRSPAATVQIDDKILSREHTQVYVSGGRVMVRDLESKNGTYLNGALIRQPEPLKHGDRIKVGPATFCVAFDAEDAAPAAPAPAPAPVAARPPPPAAPPAPARARPRSSAEQGSPAVDAVAGFFEKLILLGVVGVGAWVSKAVFLWLLGRIPR
jgi:predicted component of type VI protein secretion system